MNLPPRPVLIGGGVAVTGLLAWLYFRNRAGAGEDSGDGDLLGGSTLLFTPPAPLAAPGAGDWQGGAGTLTGGSTSFGDSMSLTDALLAQDENATRVALAESMNARQLGQAAILGQFTDSFMRTMPTDRDLVSWSYGAGFDPSDDGGLDLNVLFTVDRPAAAVFSVEQWNTVAAGTRLWQSSAGAVAVQRYGVADTQIVGTSGRTFSLSGALDFIRTHSEGEEAAAAAAEGISAADLERLRLAAAGSA